MDISLLERYDFFVNDELSLSDSDYVLLLPNKNILFLKSGERVIAINIESIYFSQGEYKEHLYDLLKDKIIVVSDYKTASLYLNQTLLNSIVSIENLCLIKNDETKIFDYVHSQLRHGEIFSTIEFLDEKYNSLKELNEEQKLFFNNLSDKDIVTHILSSALVYSNSDLNKLFVKSGNKFVRKIEYSNKRAVTGRIICIDKFNIHTLPVHDEKRKFIVSRFDNGFFVNFDYTSFETTLSMFLTNNEEFIRNNINKDLHQETANVIFKRLAIPEERKLGKNINHAIIYGAGKDTVFEILNIFDNKDEVYQLVLKFLAPLMSRAKVLEKEYESCGYIKNYFGSFIYPNKDYALYNNYVQSTAADIITKKLLAVNRILKPYKSKILTAIHDSIIVDFHPEEEFLIEIIKKEMETIENFKFNLTYKKMSSLFSE